MKKDVFNCPSKFTLIYLVINILLIISIIIVKICLKEIIFIAIPVSIFLLYNGLWSINKKWFSWIHRDNETYYIKWTWIMFIILGGLLFILEILYWLF